MPRRLLMTLAAFLATVLVGGEARAQQSLKIFDAHLHYNQEAFSMYPLEKVLEIFKRNNVTGIIATSRPNDGTRLLHAAKAPELTVVPFLRPYRVRSDIPTWFNDPDIFQLIQDEYKRGIYRGIGEFHIYGKSPEAEIARKTIAFARERDLWLHAHCDEEALLSILAQHPRGKVIWAHTGFTTPPARVMELFDKYPGLMGEMSFRSGLTDGSGQLTEEWRALFARYSDRVLLGSDTWINERWFGYDGLMKGYRAWLAQLPAEQARRIAHGNAERLFAGKAE